MAKSIKTQIRIRRDTSANWEKNNPTLALGEVGYDTTNGILKIGDGSAAWNSLASIKYWTKTEDISDSIVTVGKVTNTLGSILNDLESNYVLKDSLVDTTIKQVTSVGTQASCTLPKFTASVDSNTETLTFGWSEGSFTANELPEISDVTVITNK